MMVVKEDAATTSKVSHPPSPPIKPRGWLWFAIMSGLVGVILISMLSMGQVWHDGHEAIRGPYEAAEVVDLGNGTYRMYYDTENQPQSGIYSAFSTDAIHWKQEPGMRKTQGDWPSVTKTTDDRWRMYYHAGNSIKSALSADGLNWQDEPGVRMDPDSLFGLPLDDVSEPAVRRLNDTTYLMVYTGIVNQPYAGAPTGSNRLSLFLWALSNDGVNFEKKGIAIDSRNDLFKGQIGGSQIVKWSDGTTHVFFWSNKGIYDSVFKNNGFIDAALAFSKQPDTRSSAGPPADPTLLRVGKKWFMYYQEHNRGIYYATLDN